MFPVVPDLTKKREINREGTILEKANPAYKLLQHQQTLKQLKERSEQLAVSFGFSISASSIKYHVLKTILLSLQSEIREEAVKRRLGGRAEADFAVFPSLEMAAAMGERDHTMAARIKIPYNGPSQSLSLNLGVQDLRKIHSLLSY